MTQDSASRGLHPGGPASREGSASSRGLHPGGLHPGGSASRGGLHPGGVCIQGGLHPGEVCIGGRGGADPLLAVRDTVNKWAVHILLE